MRKYQNMLTDISRIPKIVHKYKASHSMPEDEIVPIVLGLDACSFDRITMCDHKYAFCFYVQPISPNIPCFPSHLIFNLENIDKLLTKGYFAEVMYILAYALWVTSIR